MAAAIAQASMGSFKLPQLGEQYRQCCLDSHRSPSREAYASAAKGSQKALTTHPYPYPICVVQAHPRRVAKVASQIQREVSEMFIYDKVRSSIYSHAVLSSCKHTSLAGPLTTSGQGHVLCTRPGWHVPTSNCVGMSSQGQPKASSCGRQQLWAQTWLTIHPQSGSESQQQRRMCACMYLCPLTSCVASNTSC